MPPIKREDGEPPLRGPAPALPRVRTPRAERLHIPGAFPDWDSDEEMIDGVGRSPPVEPEQDGLFEAQQYGPAELIVIEDSDDDEQANIDDQLREEQRDGNRMDVDAPDMGPMFLPLDGDEPDSPVGYEGPEYDDDGLLMFPMDLDDPPVEPLIPLFENEELEVAFIGPLLIIGPVELNDPDWDPVADLAALDLDFDNVGRLRLVPKVPRRWRTLERRNLRWPETAGGPGVRSVQLRRFGQVMLDQQGVPVEAALARDYHILLWVPYRARMGFTWRTTSTPDRVITLRRPAPNTLKHRVLTRCCRLWSENPIQSSTPEYRAQLSLDVEDGVDDNKKVEAISVGICASSGNGVAMTVARRNQNQDEVDLGRNFDGLQFRTVLWNVLSGFHTILQEDLMVPGNFVGLKRAIHLGERNFAATGNLPLAAKRANVLCLRGQPILPPHNHSADNGVHRPDFGTLYDSKGLPGENRMYTLRLAPLGALDIPEALITYVQWFLGGYPRDPIPVNLALQAIFSYIDEESCGWPMEPYNVVVSKRKKQNIPRQAKCWMVPDVPMSVYAIYYPHMLRYMEEHRLCHYIHPARFAERHYPQDQAAGPEFKLHRHLDEGLVRALYRQITPKVPGLSRYARMAVLLVSWPGSVMQWPLNVPWAAPPLRDLWSLCLMDDIRTFGLPVYRTMTDKMVILALPQVILGTRETMELVNPDPEVRMKTTTAAAWTAAPWAGLWFQAKEAYAVGPVWGSLSTAVVDNGILPGHGPDLGHNVLLVPEPYNYPVLP
ncbi:hypothetical protein G7046_g8045 [Stylonectria norvegica]|nr:hypothetical protein G7046_g8045 [Stylonectria norvegica]